MTRRRSLTLVALLVCSVVAATGTGAAQTDEAVVAVEVEATPDPADPGTNVTVETTVENVHTGGEAVRVQRADLREGETRDSTRTDDVRVTESVQPGTETTVRLHEEFDETGEFDRYVHLKLLSPDGEVIQVVRPVTVEVRQNHPSLSLSGGDASPSGDADLTLTVANGLPQEVRGVTLDVESDSLTVTEDRRVVSSLGPGNEAQLTVPAEDVEPGQQRVEVRMSYVTADGESRSTTETLTTTTHDDDSPGTVDLTGLRVAQDGDVLEVRGSASNVGSTNVSGVLVEVADGDGVAPAQNQASYFVGEVDASDYSSFEVRAALDTVTNETVTVPLEVTYRVDGEQVTRTVEVEYTPAAPDDEGDDQQASAFGVLPLAVGGVVVVLIGGVLWRRFR